MAAESNVQQGKDSASGGLGFIGAILGFAGTAGGIIAGLSDKMGEYAIALAFLAGFLAALVGALIGTGLGKLVDKRMHSEPEAVPAPSTI